MKSKKKTEEGGGGQEGIRALNCSLTILLLAFFIVLNSIAVVDDQHKLEALGSLTGSFGILPGGSSPFSGKGKGLSPPQSPIMDRDTDRSDLQSLSMPASDQVIYRSTPKGETVSIYSGVLFEEGKYDIKRSAYSFLIRLCEIINRGEYPVEITGHTDDRAPEEKSFESNWALSALRALEVFKFFTSVGKVSPDRLTPYGRAEYDPVASNETRQTRALNRRVDIVLDRQARAQLRDLGNSQEKTSKFVIFKRFVFEVFD